MKLFDMSDYDIDRAVQAHYNNLYNAYYDTDEPEPCCKYCRYYNSDGVCSLLEDKMTLEEQGEALKTGNWHSIQREEDDYCDYYEQRDDDYPDYMDGDD